MAARRFELPGVQDLSKEQEDALMLEKGGQHLVIGGPGTGKSVVALLRARRHQRDGDDYIFLVYNHLLRQASQQLFGEALCCDTWIRWFRRTFEKLTGQRTPDRGESYDIDWPLVLQGIDAGKLPEGWRPPHLVIDEGQDMPVDFYRALVALGFENFYVVADQNQQIHPDRHSSRQDIQDALCVDPAAVVELRRNYRNPYPIARLARSFYTGDPASPPPELPPARTSVALPQLFSYREHQYPALIRRIVDMASNEPHKLIGVIVPRHETRERYLQALEAALPVSEALPFSDEPAPVSLSSYDSSEPYGERRFDQGGIMVITAHSCKGLEFDTVVLADIHRHHLDPGDGDQLRKLFYVMSARARDRLIILRALDQGEPILALLPDDASVLERHPRPIAQPS